MYLKYLLAFYNVTKITFKGHKPAKKETIFADATEGELWSKKH
jgi:hypothetical protein